MISIMDITAENKKFNDHPYMQMDYMHNIISSCVVCLFMCVCVRVRMHVCMLECVCVYHVLCVFVCTL